MTTSNDSPSILILRSSCGVGGGGNNEESDLNSLPLWCDLTVLPEIGEMKHVNVHVQQQGLNPCGVDNVLLLQDLSPGQGYLMSLLNCYTHVGDGENYEEIPVSTSPSTFFFDVPASQSVKDGGVMINTKKSSTELHVDFDMTAAAATMQSQLVSGQDDAYTNNFSSPVFTTIRNTTSCQRFSGNDQDEVLRVLEAIAAREVRDVDFLLASLGVIFAILVGVYAWIATSIVKQNEGRRAEKKNGNKKKKPAANIVSPALSLPRPSLSSAMSMEFTERRAETDIPPVVDVIMDRSQVNETSRLVGERPRPPLAPAISSNSRRSQTKAPPTVVDAGVDRHQQANQAPASKESDLVKSIRASPIFAKFSGVPQKKELAAAAAAATPSFIIPPRDRQKITPPAVTSSIQQLPANSGFFLPPRKVAPKSQPVKESGPRDLSPCSRLAMDWEHKKAARRNKRRTRSAVSTVPIAVPEESLDDVIKAARKRLVPVFDANNSVPKPPTDDQPNFSGVPTSVSDGSFLNDYW